MKETQGQSAHTRFAHLLELASECEVKARVRSQGWRMQEKYMRLAALYREMAQAAMPDAVVEAATPSTKRTASPSIEEQKRPFFNDDIPF